MVREAQEIGIKSATAAEVLQYVALAARFRREGSQTTAEQVAANGGYLITENGKPVAGFTVIGKDGDVWVTAAGGKSGADLTAIITALLVERAHGFDGIAFQTTRPGLVRKAKRYGYEEIGRVGQATIMRKSIK